MKDLSNVLYIWRKTQNISVEKPSIGIQGETLQKQLHIRISSIAGGKKNDVYEHA